MEIKKELLLEVLKLNYQDWQNLEQVVNYYFEKEIRNNKKNLYLKSTKVLDEIDKGWNIPFPIQLQTEENRKEK